MKDNKDIRKISTRVTKEFLVDIKNKFKVGKFETILFLLRSKYSPNKYSKCDLKAIHSEITFVENVRIEDKYLQLGNHSLKYNLYVNLFSYIIETISSNLIKEFKISDIKSIIDEQIRILYKISNLIRYYIDDIVNELTFNIEKKPFFTNILILHTLNELIDEYAYIFEAIRQNKDKTLNSFWNNKNVQQLREVLKDKPLFFKQINPAPEFPYLFFEDDYKKIISKIDQKVDLNYELIYSPFRLNNEKDNDGALFDFKLPRRELILLIVIMYELDFLIPITIDSQNKEVTSKDLIYKRTTENPEANIDREIVFIIENLCSINKKRIKNVKNELNMIKRHTENYLKSLSNLIDKLRTFNGFKVNKSILPFEIKIKTNEIYRLQNDTPKGLCIFNLNIKTRLAVCLFLGVLDNESIANFFRYDFVGMSNLFENHSLKLDETNAKSYIREIRHEQYDYMKLYHFSIKILNKKFKILQDILEFKAKPKQAKGFKILKFESLLENEKHK